ncbi:MAG: hypothetical protein M3Y56_05190 [Armatimonadota bacterium]|nr:hypothetical protein [Armatimonadota bacterium]
MTTPSTLLKSRSELKTTLLTGLAALAIFAGMTCPTLPGRHSAAVISVAQHTGTNIHVAYNASVPEISNHSKTFIALR